MEEAFLGLLYRSSWHTEACVPLTRQTLPSGCDRNRVETGEVLQLQAQEGRRKCR